MPVKCRIGILYNNDSKNVTRMLQANEFKNYTETSKNNCFSLEFAVGCLANSCARCTTLSTV